MRHTRKTLLEFIYKLNVIANDCKHFEIWRVCVVPEGILEVWLTWCSCFSPVTGWRCRSTAYQICTDPVTLDDAGVSDWHREMPLTMQDESALDECYFWRRLPRRCTLSFLFFAVRIPRAVLTRAKRVQKSVPGKCFIKPKITYRHGSFNVQFFIRWSDESALWFSFR